MYELVAAPVRELQRRRPQMRSVGVAHAIAALSLLAVLAFGSLNDCSGRAVQVIPAGTELALFVGFGSVAMIARVPRVSAIAPALALGASLPLLGAALSGWLWVIGQPCMGNVLDREVVTMQIVTAAAAAIVATSLWLLISRDELEPWYGTTGVVAAAAGALTVLVVGVGFTVILKPDVSLTTAALALTVPWAVVVGMTGWLRTSPAIAIVVPAIGQGLWLMNH
ncbi:MAG TPA: hypothetical protein VFX15_05490 [Actinomycetes bacterium]|nr:hypothetical protein [Actinomycetes bacterium]